MGVRLKARKEKRVLAKPGPAGRKEIPYPASCTTTINRLLNMKSLP